MIEIRLAVPADADVISELAAEVQALHAAAHPRIFKPAGPDTFPARTIRERIAASGQRWWVATTDREVAGYACATMQSEPETSWRYAALVVTLDQMGVAPRHRGYGAGTRLVAAVRNAAAAFGAAEVRLNVWAFNDGARTFYRRCGFVRVQERLWLPTGADADAGTPEPDESLQLPSAMWKHGGRAPVEMLSHASRRAAY